jgi:hypothetical protein
MTARHSPLFNLESGQSGLGVYTSGRDSAIKRGRKTHGHRSTRLTPHVNLPAQARQHSDGDHQQQPIDSPCVPQAAALELEHSRFLIPEQLLTAKALGITPDQIQRGLCVADQAPGFLHRQAGGVGKDQIQRLSAISPEVLRCRGSRYHRAGGSQGSSGICHRTR